MPRPLGASAGGPECDAALGNRSATMETKLVDAYDFKTLTVAPSGSERPVMVFVALPPAG
jgi:hypothetical protein